jgi:hypothetical protein
MLEITGLATRYGDVLALDGCSLRVITPLSFVDKEDDIAAGRTA